MQTLGRSFLQLLFAGMFMVPGIFFSAPAAAAATSTDAAGPAKSVAALCKPVFPAAADLAAISPPVSLAPLTDQVAADDQTDLILYGPADGPALSKLNYKIQITGEGAGTNPITRPIVTQQPNEDQIKKVGLANSSNAVVLRVYIPARKFDPVHLNRKWTIAVVGCTEAGPNASGIFAKRIIKVTDPWVAILWSSLLVAILYLVAATCVWAQRKAAAKESDPPEKPVQPLRLEAVQPWPWVRCLNPIMLTSDMYDRGSLSQLQILFFAGITLFGMTELAFTTGGLSSLSPTIVYLLGIPAAGTLSAQLANASRDRLSTENWAWLVNRGALPLNDPGTRTPRWRDLIMQDDSEVDLSKLQALGFSIVVGISLIKAGFSGLGSFTVPSEVLQILALSQVVFVGGRFTKPATMGDIDQLLTKLRERYAILRRSMQAGVDLTLAGTPGTAANPPASRITSFVDAKAKLPNAVAQYSEIADEVVILLVGLTHRSIDKTSITEPDLT